MSSTTPTQGTPPGHWRWISTSPLLTLTDPPRPTTAASPVPWVERGAPEALPVEGPEVPGVDGEVSPDGELPPPSFPPEPSAAATTEVAAEVDSMPGPPAFDAVSPTRIVAPTSVAVST